MGRFPTGLDLSIVQEYFSAVTGGSMILFAGSVADIKVHADIVMVSVAFFGYEDHRPMNPCLARRFIG